MNELNDTNFELFAAKHYDNPSCKSMNEFRDDLGKIKYIKRLVQKYINIGEIRDKLLLNHIIVFYNMFGVKASTKMLRFKCDKEEMACIKPFLLFLKYIDEYEWQDIEDDPVLLGILYERLNEKNEDV